MKTINLKWIALALSALLVFSILGCSIDGIKENHDKTCFTVLDATNDSPIEGAYISTRYERPSSVDICVPLSYTADENGQVCLVWPYSILCYGHVSANGYVAKEFPDGNIPTIIKLVPL